jgi:hypothetical protein
MASPNNLLPSGIRTRCHSSLGSPLNAPNSRPVHNPAKRSKGLHKHYSQKFGREGMKK